MEIATFKIFNIVFTLLVHNDAEKKTPDPVGSERLHVEGFLIVYRDALAVRVDQLAAGSGVKPVSSTSKTSVEPGGIEPVLRSP